MQHVPYRGSAPMLTELLAGQAQIAFDNLQPSIPHIKAGKLRALAVTTATRSEALPDLAGSRSSARLSLLVPAGPRYPRLVTGMRDDMLIRPFLASALLLTLAGAVVGQSWPAKQPIRVILPFSPGSSLDTLGRPVFDHMAKQIGQSFVFEHRSGAGGTLGMAQVAKAEADGYTLLLNSSVQTITPSTYTLAFDVARDFAGIAPLAQFPNVLIVPLSGFKTVSDLVAAAKAKPGSLTFGSGGVGAATHLTAERFMLSAGIKAVHVPFKGAPDVLREILGGRLDFYFSPLASAMPLIESKQVRALAVTSGQRSPSVPDIPTMLEAGFPNSEYVFWIGAFAPAATPRDIVQRLHETITKALADPDVQNGIKKLAAEPMPLTPEKFDDFIKREIETNAALVKAAGITPN